MKKPLFLSILGASLALPSLIPAPAHAWFPQGHSIIASAAIEALPDDVPAWFRDGKLAIAHSAQDPDIQKNRALSFMSDAEAPKHFFDFELLQGRPLPPTYRQFLQLCNELKIAPSDVGQAPYSIAEETERLTLIFAEARAYPDNSYIRAKALVEAGILAHYAGDICMPLHATVDHDGRALPNGKSPRSGIHAKIDSLIEKLDLKPASLAKNQEIAVFPDLLGAVSLQISDTRGHIAPAYALETQLPDTKKPDPNWKATPELEAFTQERARAATKFTASLLLTAWRDSATIELPTWLSREK